MVTAQQEVQKINYVPQSQSVDEIAYNACTEEAKDYLHVVGLQLKGSPVQKNSG